MSDLTLDDVELRLRSTGDVLTVVGPRLLFEITAFKPGISWSIETAVMT